MEFQAQPGRPFEFRLIPPLLADLMKGIPHWGLDSSQKVDERLYPPPSKDPTESELIGDWSVHVQPGLAEHFQSCREIVESDLRKMQQEENGLFQMEIPTAHAEAWINSLTQARLAIVSELNITEAELSDEQEPEITDKRELAVFQVNFYGFLTHCFVEHLTE